MIRKVGEARTLFGIDAVLEEIQPGVVSAELSMTDPASGSGRVAPRSQPTIVVGEPPVAGERPVCFVIMPFTERSAEHQKGFFSEVLSSLIIPAATDAGFVVKTAHRKGSDVIQSTIVRELLKADLVLADLTEHNPNVLFELGMRMREDKPVVLIRAEGTGRIFDVDNMLRVEEYDGRLWKSTIEDDLPKLTEHIRGAWENRENEDTYMRLLGRDLAVGR
ncbi:MAG TPA: hypothetical protein VK324_02450 [Tepidisphaeraceae bacterium]|nr:hypothetical protein [Tepidisphaeraceae bacterium]